MSGRGTVRVRSTAAALLSVAAALAVSGCAPAPDPALIRILDNGFSSTRFEPSAIEISVGTEVRWRNAGARERGVSGSSDGSASTPPEWTSGPIRPGETFSYRFDAPGTYTYFGSDDETGVIGTIEVLP